MLAEDRGKPDEMDGLRVGIDAVDEEIVRLLDRRARLARKVGEIKRARAWIPTRPPVNAGCWIGSSRNSARETFPGAVWRWCSGRSSPAPSRWKRP